MSSQICFFNNYNIDELEEYNNKIEETAIDEFKIISFPQKKKSYNKDGTIDKRKCNKKQGVSSEVYPFKTKEEINAMINVFNNKISKAATEQKRRQAARNKLMFKLGLNLGIRASDLRTLKWNFFFELNEKQELSFKDYYTLQPKKQKKQHKFVKLFFNQTVKDSIDEYLKMYPFKKITGEYIDEYIFPSQKPSNKQEKILDDDTAISEATMWQIIKSTAKEAGITQNIGSHSLRKTWGFWVWHDSTDKDKMLVVLQHCFNHSSTQVTLKYIGLLDKEIKDAYESVELGNENIVAIN